MRVLFLACVAAFLFCGQLFAQSETDSLTNNILTTKVYRKGLYRSLQEFKTNSPSDTARNLVLVKRTSADRYAAGGNSYKLFIKSTDEQHDRPLRGEYWGYCDGKNVFVRMPGKHVNLEMLETLGVYCFFTNYSAATPGVIVLSVVGGAVGGAIGASIDDGGAPWIVNFNTGTTAHLTGNLADKILEKDPDLKAKIGPVYYYQGNRKAIIKQFNQRNQHLIKPF